MLVAWDFLGEGHYSGFGVSLLLQTLEEEMVWGTVLLAVPLLHILLPGLLK